MTQWPNDFIIKIQAFGHWVINIRHISEKNLLKPLAVSRVGTLFTSQRTQEIQDVLFLLGQKCIEIADHCVGFRAGA